MSVFTECELEFLASRSEYADGAAPRLGRIATVGADGTPHVVPVGFRYHAEHDAIEVRGHSMEASKKYRDIRRAGRAAIVVDDLRSSDPWQPRGVEIRGRAEALDGDRPMIRIHPERIVSWGLASGDSARTVDEEAAATSPA